MTPLLRSDFGETSSHGDVTDRRRPGFASLRTFLLSLRHDMKKKLQLKVSFTEDFVGRLLRLS